MPRRRRRETAAPAITATTAKAMAIAAEICVYTNRNIIIEALESV